MILVNALSICAPYQSNGCAGNTINILTKRLIATGIQLVNIYIFGLYRSLWEYASIEEYSNIYRKRWFAAVVNLWWELLLETDSQ